MGIEPTAQAWEAWVLPLYDARDRHDSSRVPQGRQIGARRASACRMAIIDTAASRDRSISAWRMATLAADERGRRSAGVDVAIPILHAHEAKRGVLSSAQLGYQTRGAAQGKSKLAALELRIFLKALLLPPGGSLLIGMAGLLIWTRRPRFGFALCAVSIGSLWLLAMPIVSDALTRATEGYPALDPAHLTETQARAQAIVILGGGVRRNAPEVGGDAPSSPCRFAADRGRQDRAQRPSFRSWCREVRAKPPPCAGSWRKICSSRCAGSRPRPPIPMKTRCFRRGCFGSRESTGSSWSPRGRTWSARSAEFTAAGFEVTAAPAEMWTHDERGALAFVPTVLALDRSHSRPLRVGRPEWLDVL